MSKLIYFLVPIGILLSGVSIINTQKGSNLPNLSNISGHLTTISARPPSIMDFCGEAVPLSNPKVKKRMEKELQKNVYYHSSAVYLIKKAGRYQKTFTEILKKNGVPEDFFYLAVAESNLSNAISNRGAKGFWQFMKGPGQYYGLEISATVDERFHPVKATEAAARYFKDEYNQFGNWSLVAAAYNMGSPRLKRAIKSQQEDSYYALDLNRETSKYLYRVLSMKTLLENPVTYGFSTPVSFQPVQTYSVRVSTSISDLAAFAKENGSTFRMLKLLNPWLISDHLDAQAGKTYQIHFPISSDPNAKELIVQGTKLPKDSSEVDIDDGSVVMTDDVVWE